MPERTLCTLSFTRQHRLSTLKDLSAGTVHWCHGLAALPVAYSPG